MAILYLDEQGSSVYREKGILIVKKDENILAKIPFAQIDSIIILGAVFITPTALNLIFGNSIFTSFLTIDGRYKGSLFSGFSKNIFLRLKQYELYNNQEFRQQFSKIIVLNKIKNNYTLLLKYKRNHRNAEIDEEIGKIKSIIDNLKEIKKININQLLGIEGISSKYYFSAFSKMLRKELAFKKRTSHPPKDPVNSLLSLGYTLLFNEFVSLIYSNGLDPFIGYYHELEYGRESLAVDLMEGFRFIIDSFVLQLINKNVIKKDDFEFNTEKGCYIVKDKPRKSFYKSYEVKLLTNITIDGKLINYRKIFSNQVLNFSKSLKDNSINTNNNNKNIVLVDEKDNLVLQNNQQYKFFEPFIYR